MNRNPYLRSALVVLAFGCLANVSLEAQETRRWTTWMFQGENDSLALFSGSDEFYTNGIRFYGLRHPDFAPRWVDGFADWWCSWACPQLSNENSFGFAFGQLIYTPDDLSIAELIPDDRPYASWLYGALVLQISDDRLKKQHALELQLGIIGPEAGGEWAQTNLHELIEDEEPMGWDNQLPTEPGISLIYRYRESFGRERFGRHFDVVPHFGGALGTIMVMVNAGATVRAGWNISGMPQALIPTTAAPTEKRSKWELYVFAGAEGRALAHNVFLDGTVFRDSHSVEKEDYVYDLTAGFSLRYKNWRFQYTFVRRSEEFFPRRGRFDGLHDFGSISLGVERSF